ncbi:hypothetical protein [Roseobacter sp. TSBP12]|uniref:hypothetical protein n=1 Tax=Roseobacter sp. TSBP12 TaxID=1236613 RepID=UPI00125EFF1B|nr:hypothetical protein [Roseobacter sp. TSBP12]KAB6717727.1 hypothetical protein C8029_04195 [Roseobacter sp. TSBP12]
MTPKLPLSDRLRMVRVIPSYVLTMDEADSQFVEQAVREKEQRETRGASKQPEMRRLAQALIFGLSIACAGLAALLIYGVP